MNWNKYKLLTKEEREEYNFNFKDTPTYVFGPMFYFGALILIMLVGILAQVTGELSMLDANIALTKLLTVMVISDVVFMLSNWLAEHIWIKKHLKTIHK